MTERGSLEAHNALINDILVAFGSLSNIRIWKNDVGVGRALDNDRVLRWGLKGSSDIIGVGLGGKFIAIEVKTGKARQSEQQKNFQNMVNSMGGIYIVARSIQDVRDMVNKFS
jgi:VRR-NUC domain